GAAATGDARARRRVGGGVRAQAGALSRAVALDLHRDGNRPAQLLGRARDRAVGGAGPDKPRARAGDRVRAAQRDRGLRDHWPPGGSGSGPPSASLRISYSSPPASNHRARLGAVPRYATVYPLVTTRALARPFTYELVDGAAKGAVVSVPLGRSRRRGVVVEL